MSNTLSLRSDRIGFNFIDSGVRSENVVITTSLSNDHKIVIGGKSMINVDSSTDLITSFNTNKVAFVVDASTMRVGIGTINPTRSLDIRAPEGIIISGAMVLDGPATFAGTLTANTFIGNAFGLSNIIASRLVGTLAASVFAPGSIPIESLITGGSGGQISFTTVGTSFLSTGTLETGRLIVNGRDLTQNPAELLTGKLCTLVFAPNLIPADSIKSDGQLVLSSILVSSIAGNGLNMSNVPASLLSGFLRSSVFANRTIPTESLQSTGKITISEISASVARTNIAFTQLAHISTISTGSLNATDLFAERGIFSTLSTEQTAITEAFVQKAAFSTLSAGTLIATNTVIQLGSFSTVSTAAFIAADSFVQKGAFSSLSAGVTVAGEAFIKYGAFSSISAGVLQVSTISASFLTTQLLNIDALIGDRIAVSSGSFSTISTGFLRSQQLSTLSLDANQAQFSTALINKLSIATSIHAPIINVTNIYADTENALHIIASSMNVTSAIFINVLASSFNGKLLGLTVMDVADV